MAYSDFKLDSIIKQFGLEVREAADLFSAVPAVEPSAMFIAWLNETAPLALDINTEKARSEMIIAPVLLEVRRQVGYRIGLFSGTEFNVAAEQGLNGVCDFLISLSSESLFIQSPVVALVEAKKEDIKGGLGQCIAEMLAAQMFNQQEGNPIPKIYGVVTSGNIWRFLTLEQQTVAIDRVEYYLNQIDKILGVLVSAVT